MLRICLDWLSKTDPLYNLPQLWKRCSFISAWERQTFNGLHWIYLPQQDAKNVTKENESEVSGGVYHMLIKCSQAFPPMAMKTFAAPPMAIGSVSPFSSGHPETELRDAMVKTSLLTLWVLVVGDPSRQGRQLQVYPCDPVRTGVYQELGELPGKLQTLKKMWVRSFTHFQRGILMNFAVAGDPQRLELFL